MKKVKILLAMLLVTLTVSVIGACSATNGTSNNSSNDSTVSSGTSSDSSLTVMPSLTLDKTSLTLDKYTTATIAATLTNAEGTLVWSSSDSTVAMVSSGVVTAYKEGNTTITVTVGTLTATCNVAVTATSATPVFTGLPETLTMIKGTSETLDTTMTYNQAPYLGAMFTFSTTGDTLSVSQEGVITANEYGEQTVEVKALFGEAVVATQTVTVTVIEYGIISTGLQNNVLNFVLGGDDVFVEYTIANFKAQINGIEVQKPEFNVTFDRPQIASVEDGKIVAKKAGITTATIEYTSASNKVYSTTLSINVKKGEVVETLDFLIKGNGTTNSVDTGYATLNLTETSVDTSTLTAVKCGEIDVTFTISGKTLTFYNAPCGEQTYMLETEKVNYYIDGCIYTNAISNTAELLKWRNECDSNYGYTILTADIDLQGMSLPNSTASMKNILDGRGHTICNFRTQKGFVTNYTSNGGIKNLQLINVVLEEMQYDGKSYGFLGMEMSGTIENVLIIGKTERTGVLNGLLYTCTNSGSVTKNVIAIVDNASVDYQWGLGAQRVSENAVCRNVYIATTNKAEMSVNADVKDCISFTDEGSLIDGADFAGFGGFWNVQAGRLPYMSEYETILANPVVSLMGNPIVGATMTITSTSAYPMTYTLENTVQGIAIENGVIAIAETVSHNTTFTVVAKCANNPNFEKKITVKVMQGEKATYENPYELLTAGKVTLTLSKFDKSITSVDRLLVNSQETPFETTEGKLTFSTTAGVKQLLISTGNKGYQATVKVADFEISNQASFIAWTTTVTEYAVVTQDFTCDNTEIKPSWQYATALDGLEHTITNAYLVRGFTDWNYVMTAKNVIRDINFVNMKLGNGTIGILGYDVEGGLLENVKISVSIPGRDWNNANERGAWLLARGLTLYQETDFSKFFTMRNVTINVTMEKEEDLDKKLRIYSDTWHNGTVFENVTITSNGTLSKPGEAYEGFPETTINFTDSTGGDYTKQYYKWKNVTITDKRGADAYNVNAD